MVLLFLEDCWVLGLSRKAEPQRTQTRLSREQPCVYLMASLLALSLGPLLTPFREFHFGNECDFAGLRGRLTLRDFNVNHTCCRLIGATPPPRGPWTGDVYLVCRPIAPALNGQLLYAFL